MNIPVNATAQPMDEAFQVGLDSHFVMIFDQQGLLTSVQVDGKEAINAGKPLLYVHDLKTGKQYPVTGQMSGGSNQLALKSLLADAHLEVEAQIKTQNGYISVSGVIKDLSEIDRGIDIYIVLPLNTRTWTWWKDIGNRSTVSQSSTVESDLYPFAAMTDKEGGLGVSLAIPPSEPTVFTSGFAPGFGFYMRSRFGITPLGSQALKSQVPFSFLVYSADPQWGLRDTVAQYYSFFPNVFERRAKAEGLWLWTGSDSVMNPRDYAYHEWIHRSGDFAAGWFVDDKYGILTFPYQIVGQRSVRNLRTKPPVLTTQDEVRAFLDNAKLEADAGPGWSFDLPEVVLSSGIFGSDDNYVSLIRTAGEATLSNDSSYQVAFPLNPSPYLFADQNVKTIAAVVDEWIATQLMNSPSLDGIYLDSLGLWAGYLNFRRDHLPYAQIPATFDITSERVALDNRFSHLEYVMDLADRLHQGGRYLFANGIRTGRPFLGFHLDVMGSENRLDSLLAKNYEELYFMRTVAGQKPYLLLNNHEEEWLDQSKVISYWENTVLFGMFPSYHWQAQRDFKVYKQHQSVINKYLPIAKTISAAGWQPVTLLTCDRPDVLAERFGPNANENVLYITLYNTGTGYEAELVLDLARLSWAGPVSVEEMLSQTNIQVGNATNGQVVITLPLPQKQLQVLKVTLQGSSCRPTC